jgi:hypothetical protein
MDLVQNCNYENCLCIGTDAALCHDQATSECPGTLKCYRAWASRQIAEAQGGGAE